MPRFTPDDSLVVFHMTTQKRKVKLFSVSALGLSAAPTELFPGLKMGQVRVDFKR